MLDATGVGIDGIIEANPSIIYHVLDAEAISI